MCVACVGWVGRGGVVGRAGDVRGEGWGAPMLWMEPPRGSLLCQAAGMDMPLPPSLLILPLINCCLVSVTCGVQPRCVACMCVCVNVRDMCVCFAGCPGPQVCVACATHMCRL